MAIGTILIIFLFELFNASARAWRQGEDQAETYREARAALQMMVRDLSQTIQPMIGSVYASPTPAPGAPPVVVAPVLVIDRYPNPDPPQQDGDKINEEVYCLTTITNDGASNLCAVGYFCQWDPNNRATHAFSLMRQYLGSGSPTVPGLFERFQRANAQHPSVPTLTFPEVYGRTATTLTDAPLPSMTEMASYIWDLQIRTPKGLQDATVPPLYPAQPTYTTTGYANALPAYLEIRFKALSESAAHRLAGNANVSRETWNDSQATDSIYKTIILPGTRQFSVRVPIYSGSATSTPAP